MSRLHARLQRARLEAEQLRIVAEALLASTAPPGFRAAEGDPERMRKLPVIASGVDGAIPGTRPG